MFVNNLLDLHGVMHMSVTYLLMVLQVVSAQTIEVKKREGS